MGILYKIFCTLLLLFLLTNCSSDSDGEVNSCGTVIDISANSFSNGRLESGDCIGTDVDPDSGDTTFLDEYRVTLSSAGVLTITMRSTELDSFLLLLDSSRSCTEGCSDSLLITDDDDSAGGFDATISVFLSPGTYLIIANLIDSESGSYTLETSFIE